MIKKIMILYGLIVPLFFVNETLSFENIIEKIKNIYAGNVAQQVKDWTIGQANQLGDLLPQASFQQRTLVSSGAIFFAILGAYSINRGIQEVKEAPLEMWQEIKRNATRFVKKATMGLLLTGLGMGSVVSAGFIIKIGLMGK